MKLVVIPDIQAAPGSDLSMCRWAMEYIIEHYAGQEIVIVNIGDTYDFPSLSSYDQGKKSMEGRRTLADLEAGDEAFAILDEPLIKYNNIRRRFKEKQWWPRRVYTLGNHEHRLARHIEANAQLDGILTMERLKPNGWETYDFLDIVWVEGVAFSHYMVNPASGLPLGGLMDTKLKNLGHSFVCGHIPGRQFAVRRVAAPQGSREIFGLQVGSFYLGGPHIDYQGPQSRSYWNGIVVLNELEDGQADPMFLSLEYLQRKYS